MKKHAIIPVFIPHIGCPCECVFCDQNTITARSGAPSAEDVTRTVETWLSTIEGRGLDTVEIAFFGGSFTAIPRRMQEIYLSVALKYKQAGRIDKIRLSTRPDCIDPDTLSMLESYGVDAIELGAQSFSDRVLSLSKRGHDSGAIYRASRLISGAGFELGLQLMTGLPGDDPETSVWSARCAASLSPVTARLYPTVVLKGTELADMLERGIYEPFDEETMIRTTAEMYKILFGAGVTILRVGLKSTDLVTGTADMGHSYHPAFRQLVEGRIALEKMEELLAGLSPSGEGPGTSRQAVTFSSNEKWFPPMIGHRACNKKYLAERYPLTDITYKTDPLLPDGAIGMTSDQKNGGKNQ